MTIRKTTASRPRGNPRGVPYAYIDGWRLVLVLTVRNLDQELEAGFHASPPGTTDMGDSQGVGPWRGVVHYTLRLPHPLFGAAAQAVADRVTRALQATTRENSRRSAPRKNGHKAKATTATTANLARHLPRSNSWADARGGTDMPRAWYAHHAAQSDGGLTVRNPRGKTATPEGNWYAIVSHGAGPSGTFFGSEEGARAYLRARVRKYGPEWAGTTYLVRTSTRKAAREADIADGDWEFVASA